MNDAQIIMITFDFFARGTTKVYAVCRIIVSCIRFHDYTAVCEDSKAVHRSCGSRFPPVVDDNNIVRVAFYSHDRKVRIREISCWLMSMEQIHGTFQMAYGYLLPS
mmetsp:Transcript_5718/g.10834  ORF Transcript_5718/g.10834 Transcript_5718/m.10834 type:complete len:106 (-) Transcript_5718:24-341(-)